MPSTLVASLAGAVAVLAAGALLVPTSASKRLPSINVLHGGDIAIHGYDPVAYFVHGEPRRGREDLAVVHGGARWLFSSEDNRRRFEVEPERYLPAFGGYCAYGVARGYLVKIDPEAWSIIDGQLYLNYDASVQRTWSKDPAGYIARAHVTWPSLVRSAPKAGG